ncbi:SGNH/GDSL hydrolase family protein [Aquimarina megaterium]|uniref:G-D-S-L family lipolytic protein n=1 Tax=Aquimarina megaterium TaxID=1443666 RepID=UPI0004AFA70A|nr:G-D-S-L family lipolytic protein [Aquimarina megaterium]
MMRKNIKYLAILALGIIACEPEFDNPIDEAGTYTSGEADFSNYVALGNSLTAGFADGALYITGQENSYPNILSKQFVFAGGGDFTQPLMSDNTGGFSNDPVTFPPRFVLVFDADGKPVGPATYTGAVPSTDFTNNLASSFNNMGVPGAKSFHLAAPGYGNVAGVSSGSANPYFARFASSATATVVGDAVAQNPTFFSLWIGNNDILSYATSGGVGADNNEVPNTDPSTYGPNDITNTTVFAGVYSQLIDALTAKGAKGVLLNLPSVTSIPFFTTVPYAPLSPLNPDFGPQIPTLNATYAGLNLAFAGIGVPERAIEFSTTGASAVVIKDESLDNKTAQLTAALTPTFGAAKAALFGAQYGQARQATAEDLLVLTSSSIIGKLNEARFAELVGLGLSQEEAGQLAVNGVSFPLEDKYVLIPAEQTAIENARTGFNATIAGLATAKGLAFYDAAADLAQAANGGIPIDGGMITSEFVRGGGFSLDGVHPTPRAHALITNGVLDAIKATYGANLPRVNPADYGTVTLSNDVN